MDEAPCILVAGPPAAAPFLSKIATVLRADGQEVLLHLDGSDPGRHPDWPRVSILVVFALGCDAEAIGRAAALRAIVLPSLGYEGIDVDAAAARGVLVANGAVAENFESVAEAAICLVLASMYDVRAAEHRLRTGTARAGPPRARMLRGKSVGMIGFGNIAREIARRLEGWGVELLVCSRSQVAWSSPITQCSLDVLLERADVILPLVPLTDATRHLLDRRRLLQAKEGAVLVNLSRGAVIEESALADPIVASRFSAIALDVFDREPLSPESPLRTLPNAILTGHEISHTAENLEALFRQTITNVRDVAAGRRPATSLAPSAERPSASGELMDRS